MIGSKNKTHMIEIIIGHLKASEQEAAKKRDIKINFPNSSNKIIILNKMASFIFFFLINLCLTSIKATYNNYA